MKNNNLFLLLILFLTFNVFSQSTYKDYIIYKDVDTVYCSVKKYGNLKMEFETDSKKEFAKINSSSSNLSKKSGVKKKVNPNLKTAYLSNITDVYLNDTSELFNNPLNIKIEKPEEGYAHVYLYRPYYYTGSALGCKIKYNSNNFINIKTKSYFLHKIKANQTHSYERTNKAYLTSKKRNKVEFNAENGKIYFIRAIYGTNLKIDDEKISEGMGTSIYLDETPHNKYQILNMKKKSPKI